MMSRMLRGACPGVHGALGRVAVAVGAPWITETLSAIRDDAKANGSLDRMTGGFFQNRKTKEILCHVVLVIDKVTMAGKLIFNCEAGYQ